MIQNATSTAIDVGYFPPTDAPDGSFTYNVPLAALRASRVAEMPFSIPRMAGLACRCLYPCRQLASTLAKAPVQAPLQPSSPDTCMSRACCSLDCLPHWPQVGPGRTLECDLRPAASQDKHAAEWAASPRCEPAPLLPGTPAVPARARPSLLPTVLCDMSAPALRHVSPRCESLPASRKPG